MALQKMLALKQEFLLGQLRCWHQTCQKNLLEQNKCQTKDSGTVLLIPNSPVIALPMTRFRFYLLCLHFFHYSKD